MKPLPPATALEKFAGNTGLEAALTVMAAVAGGPLAPLLPVLTKSLACERQRARVEAHLVELSHMLNAHEERLRELSDAQYKLINESILAVLQTTEQQKLALLKSVVRNALEMTDVDPMESIALSRILRDISVEEALFVVRNFGCERVYITSSEQPGRNDSKTCYVRPGSRDEMVVSGLVSLGLLTTGEPTLGQLLRWSTLVAKFIVLVQDRDA